MLQRIAARPPSSCGWWLSPPRKRLPTSCRRVGWRESKTWFNASFAQVRATPSSVMVRAVPWSSWRAYDLGLGEAQKVTQHVEEYGSFSLAAGMPSVLVQNFRPQRTTG